jgi:hypothetical protein
VWNFLDLSIPDLSRRSWLLVVGAVAVAMVVGGFVIAANSQSSPDEELCDLLHDGYTVEQLIADDTWREWPETQSALSRAAEINEAVDRGRCFERT